MVQSTQVLNTKLLEREEEVKKLRAQMRSQVTQSGVIEDHKNKIATLEEDIRWHETQVESKDAER